MLQRTVFWELNVRVNVSFCLSSFFELSSQTDLAKTSNFDFLIPPQNEDTKHIMELIKGQNFIKVGGVF